MPALGSASDPGMVRGAGRTRRISRTDGRRQPRVRQPCLVVQSQVKEGETKEAVYLRLSKWVKRPLTRLRLLDQHLAVAMCTATAREAEGLLKASGQDGVYVRAMHEDAERSRLGMVWATDGDEAQKVKRELQEKGITTMGIGRGAGGRLAVRVGKAQMGEACKMLGRKRRFVVAGIPEEMGEDGVASACKEFGWEVVPIAALAGRGGMASWTVEALDTPTQMDPEVDGKVWLIQESLTARPSVWDGTRVWGKKGGDKACHEPVKTAPTQGVWKTEEFPALGGRSNGPALRETSEKPAAEGALEEIEKKMERKMDQMVDQMAEKVLGILMQKLAGWKPTPTEPNHQPSDSEMKEGPNLRETEKNLRGEIEALKVENLKLRQIVEKMARDAAAQRSTTKQEQKVEQTDSGEKAKVPEKKRGQKTTAAEAGGKGQAKPTAPIFHPYGGGKGDKN